MNDLDQFFLGGGGCPVYALKQMEFFESTLVRHGLHTRTAGLLPWRLTQQRTHTGISQTYTTLI